MRSGASALLLACLPVLAQAPHFTWREAVEAEWARQPLAWTEARKAALPPEDRARLDRAILRIGAPGTPALLPSELDQPTAEAWEARARHARTPQARFTALFFLNRLRHPRALLALEGLTPADAAAWPKHLHLEAQIATARLNGAEITPALQTFLDTLQKAGKVDPIRAQAARLRLVMAGKEKELLPAVPTTPGSVLALMDAWNRGPWEQRKTTHLECLRAWSRLTLRYPWQRADAQVPEGRTLKDAIRQHLLLAEGCRLFDGLGAGISPEDQEILSLAAVRGPLLQREAALRAMEQALPAGGMAGSILPLNQRNEPSGLKAYRKVNPEQADRMRSRLLAGEDPIARAAAIEDLPSVPPDLEALTRRVWSDTQFETQQTLIQSYNRWKMAPEAQRTQLLPWLQHPNWTCRWEAHQALRKLDPATPWPTAPKPSEIDRAILDEATRLAERGRPVRLRITFSGKRVITLKLDPAVAPMNVANLVLLARKGYFDGRLVPRVVPDFVVQMGSPFDSMEGGPGYTVRCENSLDWYGPGSVGMALSGKDTGGSQFFITTNATPHLTGRYTRMGEVEDLDRALPILDDLELGAEILSIRVLEP
jgi:cyclophilin family peptidyl-prolyl cis-trans isomerase